jgi:hypothetical protein
MDSILAVLLFLIVFFIAQDAHIWVVVFVALSLLFQLKTTNRQYYLLGPMVLSFLGYFYYNDCRIDSFQSREGFRFRRKKPNIKNQSKLAKKKANRASKYQKKNIKAKNIYKNAKNKYKEDMKIYDGNWKSLKKIIKDSVNEPEKPGETIQQASVEETTDKGINTNQFDKTTESPQGPPMP